MVDGIKDVEQNFIVGYYGQASSHKILRSLYTNIKSSVLLKRKLSDFFVNNVGMLQGEIIPLLFSLYVKDCASGATRINFIFINVCR